MFLKSSTIYINKKNETMKHALYNFKVSAWFSNFSRQVYLEVDFAGSIAMVRAVSDFIKRR